MSESMSPGLASVASLWRYPVKSMQGEMVDRIDIGLRGLAEDRIYAIRTADGKFGSGKNTRRFRHIDGLLGYAAFHVGDTPKIRFPDGRIFATGDAGTGAALSAALGQAVSLAREQDVSHFDAGSVHILTAASLRWLQSKLPSSAIDPRRFRPNLLVAMDGEERAEQSWIGREIGIGSLVMVVEVAARRCVMATMAQPGLPEDAGVLRVLAEENDSCFGVYARVVVPGTVSVHDKLLLR